jgi:hypothetical protein
MSAKLAVDERGQIVRPAVGGEVTPVNPAAFVYVLRDDSDYIAREFQARLGATDGATGDAIVAQYQDFLAELYSVFVTAAEARGPLELHVYPAQALEQARSELLGGDDLVVASLDPLCTYPGVFHLGLSRWYKPGGWDLAGEGSRPGFAAVDDQITQLRELAAGRPVALIEDDMYTGETLAATVSRLRAARIDVRQVVVGVRICQTDLPLADVATSAAVRYRLDASRPISDQIDLGDPRDYLVGLSGLVIVMDEAAGRPALGRAPYVLPFVRPSDRASFPAESDWTLSRSILRASAEFYDRLSARLGQSIRVRHADPEFAALANTYLGTEPDQPMTDFIDEVLANAETIADRFFG